MPLHPARRGPKPKVSDADLLAAIRADLAASPFTGEGHRKVWARLRILSNIRVGRSRVLRLMREHQLLSPHRRPQGAPVRHDGTITTERPNAMWGTDGIRIETVDEGWVWVFSAVDHFDACCVGIHAVKIGNRFAALQPIAQGLQSEFGPTGADAGRGLVLRMDNGTQYTVPTTSSTRSSSGASHRASPSLPSRRPTASPSASTGPSRSRPFTAASSKTSRSCAPPSPRSRTATITIGVSKNWASCHPLKPVRPMPCERQPELQNSVQSIRAGTFSSL
ncbi:MAG: IS3 family transposase [Dechloromonas sp.]|nr:IS3 family transposase [Dechloromonas sp.]